MKNRASIGLLIACIATIAAAPSYGQVYKWVDSNGRVNYSNEPPTDSASSKTLKVVEPNISVYTTDESLKRAIEEYRQRKNYAAASDRYYAAAVQPTCADYGMVASPAGCQPVDYGSSGYSPYYPYAPAVVYGRVRPRPVLLARSHITPGTIAGNSVGMNGYIPGLSAQAAAMAPPPTARPPHVSPAGRGMLLR